MKITTVQAAVNTRAKNLATLAQDQAGGCKTFKSWLWKVEGEAYDENHQ